MQSQNATFSRAGGLYKPEMRLSAIWPSLIFAPIGCIIIGTTLQFRTHWIGPVFGIGVFIFGAQIGATTVQTYCVDAHPSRSAESSMVLNFFRQILGFLPPFFQAYWAELDGVVWAFCVPAILIVVLFAPCVVVVMIKGESFRRWSVSHILGIDKADASEIGRQSTREDKV